MTRILLIGVFLLYSICICPETGAQTRGISMEDAVSMSGLPGRGGAYRALIIGNDDYGSAHGPWRPLKTAVAGARAFKDLLGEQYGFSDVTLLENATRRDILIALKNFSRSVAKNDSVIMYYAGHGYLDIETQKGYWVPVDAENTDHTTFIRNSTIRDELSIIAARAKHTLLISDSCFSGTLLKSGTRSISSASGTDVYYRKMAQKKSIQILTAGGVEYVDDNYLASGHSPFTYFLLSELKYNPKPLLSASELSTNLEKAVGNNVDQVPQSGVLQGAGDEMGEFIFINVDVIVEGVPKDKVKVNVRVTEAEAEKPPKRDKDTRLGLGQTISATAWNGENQNSGTDFNASAIQLGLNLTFQKKRFYTRLGFQFGEFAFKEDAPDQVMPTQIQSFRDVKVTHTELDLDVGYYFWKHIAVLFGFRLEGNKWRNNDYEISFAGFAGGITGNWPVSKNWELYGCLMLMPNTAVTNDGNKIGDVSGGQLTFGAAYTIKNRHRIGFGTEVGTRTYDYDIDEKQDHRYIGLFVGYSYQFVF